MLFACLPPVNPLYSYDVASPVKFDLSFQASPRERESGLWDFYVCKYMHDDASVPRRRAKILNERIFGR